MAAMEVDGQAVDVEDACTLSGAPGSDAALNPSLSLGLRNLGNTCYLNASVQSLVHCPPLLLFLVDCQGHLDLAPTDSLVQALGSTFAPSHDRSRPAFPPAAPPALPPLRCHSVCARTPICSCARAMPNGSNRATSQPLRLALTRPHPTSALHSLPI